VARTTDGLALWYIEVAYCLKIVQHYTTDIYMTDAFDITNINTVRNVKTHNPQKYHSTNVLYLVWNFTHTQYLYTKFLHSIKKFTQPPKNLHKPGLQVCAFFHVCVHLID
jgi:hypothetical protein